MQDRSFLEIDLDRLEKEWVGQPLLIYDYMRQKADAGLELDRAKGNLDLVEAELDRKVRLSPEKYGLPEKPTEGGIKAAIKKRQSYQDALTDVMELRHKQDVLAAAVAALDHRKRALQGLVDLHGQGYFATPKAKSLAGRLAIEEGEKRYLRRRGKEEPEGED
jgi:hypothetical protein